MKNIIPSPRLYGPYFYKGLGYKYLSEIESIECIYDQILDDSSRNYIEKIYCILCDKYSKINVKLKLNRYITDTTNNKHYIKHYILHLNDYKDLLKEN